MLLSKREELERAALSPNAAGAQTTADSGDFVATDQPIPSSVVPPTSPVPPPPPLAASSIENQEKQAEADIDTVRAALESPEEGGNASPASWLNQVFMQAVALDASDIHIAPEKDYLSVRFRMNGIIHEVAKWSIDYHDTILSRLKVIAGMQVVERNIPQDGHLELLLEAPPKKNEQGDLVRNFVELNFRVATMPTVNGEVAVLRALNKERGLLVIDQVGFSPKAMVTVKKVIQRGHGVFLMTGHSGSGKTTTLYSILNYINSRDKVILTLEDPVEYRVENVRQSQVSPAVGFSFEAGLRAILRQDPDMIMIGEIRDEQTAATAMRLALVGRLVLTTLHTNSIGGALIRLSEMDIERSIVSSALTAIVAERLVQKICEKCRVLADPPYELLKMFEIEWTGEQAYRGQGCDACHHTGFDGRIGIFEILEITDEFRNLIISAAPISEIEAYIEKKVPETLRQDGFNKVRQGITTLEEVIRATI